jgi:hypothetical protein
MATLEKVLAKCGAIEVAVESHTPFASKGSEETKSFANPQSAKNLERYFL